LRLRSGFLLARRLRLAGAAAVLALLTAGVAAGEAGDAAPPAGPSQTEAPAGTEHDSDAEDASPTEEAAEPAAEEVREATIVHSQETDPENIGTPIFPQARYRDAVRLRLQSHFVPSSDFGSANVGLYDLNARLRVTVPLSKRGVLQFTGLGGTTRYDFDGTSDLFGLGPTSSDPVDGLYSALLAAQGAYRLNDSDYLFVDGESWSLLGAVYGRSRWEGRDFTAGLTGGGTVGFGYQNARLRVSVGARLESKLSGSGVSVGPIASIRWDPTKRLTLRNRGTGGQVEYRLNGRWKVFVTSYVTNTRYRLENRVGVVARPVLRDRQVLVGAGFQWNLWRHLRLNLEGGAVTSHKIEIHSDGATLGSITAEPSGYFDITLSLRP
jgi:hypothetical protein